MTELTDYEEKKLKKLRKDLCDKTASMVNHKLYEVEHRFNNGKECDFKYASALNSHINETNGGFKQIIGIPGDKGNNYVSLYTGVSRFVKKMVASQNCVVTSLYKVKTPILADINSKFMGVLHRKFSAPCKRDLNFESCGMSKHDSIVKDLNDLRDTFKWQPRLSKNGFITLLYSTDKNDNTIYICVRSTAPASNLDLRNRYAKLQSQGKSLSSVYKSGWQQLHLDNSMRNCDLLAFEMAQMLCVEIDHARDVKFKVSDPIIERPPMRGIPCETQVSNYFVKLPDVLPHIYSKYVSNIHSSNEWSNYFPTNPHGRNRKLSVYGYFKNCTINSNYSYHAKPQSQYMPKESISSNVVFKNQQSDIGGRCCAKKHPWIRDNNIIQNGNIIVMLKRKIPTKKCHVADNCSICKPGLLAVPMTLRFLNRSKESLDKISMLNKTSKNFYCVDIGKPKPSTNKSTDYLSEVNEDEKTDDHVRRLTNKLGLRGTHLKYLPLIKIVN